MCCSCEKKRLSFWGVLLCLGFLGGAIAAIILGGVNFNLTNTNFAEGWKSLSAVQIASIIYVFFVCGLGIFTFWCDQWCLTLLVI